MTGVHVVGYDCSVVHTTPNGVPLRLRNAERLAVCELISRQRQAFNFGVVVCLDAVEKSGRVPSRFDCWKLLTEARMGGAMPSDAPLRIQRPGVALGRDVVKKWHKARVSHDNNAANTVKHRAWSAIELDQKNRRSGGSSPDGGPEGNSEQRQPTKALPSPSSKNACGQFAGHACI